MFVQRYYDERLAQASYLVACQRTGEAIVFDPARDIAPYLDTARRKKFTITDVTETHIHADFLSGTRELAAATGAKMLLSGEGGRDWQYRFATDASARILHDGDVITLGGVRIDVVHTPGHTPEHLVFIIHDTARSDEPLAMVSGDFIFVGDVGRPDLLELAAGIGNTKEAGARDMYRSLERLASLPDHLQIWPGHGAGSACGKALGAVPTSTLGYERRTNWAFQERDETRFVAAILEGQPDPPVYFATMKRLNRDGPPLLGNVPPLSQAHISAFPDAMASGVVIDVRGKQQFARAHYRGTLNIPLFNPFTTWAGWLVSYDRDLWLIAPDAESAEDGARALRSIGLDRIGGFFDASEVLELAAKHSALQNTAHDTITHADALQREGVTVLDLRTAHDWDEGHLDGARHAPLETLIRSADSIARSTPIAVHCGAGTRSAIGASVLQRMGFEKVIDLTDGWSGLAGER